MSKYMMYGKTKVLNSFARVLNKYLNSIKGHINGDDVDSKLIKSGKIEINTDTIDTSKIYVALQELGLLYNMQTHPTVEHLQLVLDAQLDAPYKMHAYTSATKYGRMRRIYIDIPAPETDDDIVNAHIAKIKMYYNLVNNQVEINTINAPTLGYYIDDSDDDYQWNADDAVNNMILEMRQSKCDAVLDVHRKQIKVYIKHLLKRTGYDKIKELR